MGTCVGDDLGAWLEEEGQGEGREGQRWRLEGTHHDRVTDPGGRNATFLSLSPWLHPPEVTAVLVHGKLPAGPCRWGFTLGKIVCDQKESILTPCWIYFCDLNSYFAGFFIVGVHSACLREPLPPST